MLTFTIRDQQTQEKFSLQGQSIRDLELKLNLSDYGHTWSEIGDHLFKFYNYSGSINQPDKILVVNSEQYSELFRLSQLDYQTMLNQKHNVC